MERIKISVPGKLYGIRGLKLICPICLTLHHLEGVGYKLPQTEEEIKQNCARIVLRSISGDTPVCDCLLERLEKFPVVCLWDDISRTN